MNAILRRSTEMITPEAWAELDAQANHLDHGLGHAPGHATSG